MEGYLTGASQRSTRNFRLLLWWWTRLGSWDHPVWWWQQTLLFLNKDNQHQHQHQFMRGRNSKSNSTVCSRPNPANSHLSDITICRLRYTQYMQLCMLSYIKKERNECLVESYLYCLRASSVSFLQSHLDGNHLSLQLHAPRSSNSLPSSPHTNSCNIRGTRRIQQIRTVLRCTVLYNLRLGVW